MINPNDLQSVGAGKNYIAGGTGDSNVMNVVTYADGATPIPTSMSASPGHITITAINPLSERYSFSIAPGVQGDGQYWPFTIYRQDTYKVLRIKFQYEIETTASYTDGDLSVFIYDVTNATLIYPVPNKIINAVGPASFTADFQTTGSTSYRLIIHQTTSAASWGSVKVDSMFVYKGDNPADTRSVAASYYGSDASAMTGTLAIYKGQSRAFDTHGMINPTTGVITIPFSGKYRLSAAIETDAAANADKQYVYISVRTGSVANSGTEIAYNWAFFQSGVSNTPCQVTTVFDAVAGATYTVQGASNVGGSRNFYTSRGSSRLELEMISGPSQVASNEVVAARVYKTANESIASSGTPQVISMTGVTLDTHGGWASNAYTVKVSGVYKIYAQQIYAWGAVSKSSTIIIRKNASNVAVGEFDAGVGWGGGVSNSPTISTSYEGIFSVGDVIDFYTTQQNSGAASTSIVGSSTQTFASIERLSGPSQIAASELQLSEVLAVKSISSSQALSIVDGTILASGATTLTLPSASQQPGKRYRIKKTDALNTITIDGYGSETIDGSLTFTLSNQYEAVELVSDGSAWYVI